MIFNNNLTLKKTHDKCVSGKPALTVVMIHGIAADSSSFNNALAYLEGTTSMRNVRFVTFDLLGWGQSKKSEKLNYDYHDQLEALYNSIEKLRLTTPLVLVGHSMGTFIVTRYADTYKKTVKQLILISPPVYTTKDMASPLFTNAMDMFKNKLSENNRNVVTSRSFINSMKNIVLNKRNYSVLEKIKTPTVLIWGELDAIIASFNIPNLLKENPKYLSAIQTPSAHSVSKDKYSKLVPILEKLLNA